MRQSLKNEENAYHSVRQQGRSRDREVDEERPEAEQGLPQAGTIGKKERGDRRNERPEWKWRREHILDCGEATETSRGLQEQPKSHRTAQTKETVMKGQVQANRNM